MDFLINAFEKLENFRFGTRGREIKLILLDLDNTYEAK